MSQWLTRKPEISSDLNDEMKEEDMNTAEICWLGFFGVIVLVAIISFLSSIPELRRYFRVRSM
jgi:hypothetical protein